MTRRLVLVVAAGLLGCSSPQHDSGYTLYRNSDVSTSSRIHWATFDAAEPDPSYNANNCAMAARLLNANMRASAEAEGLEPHRGVGFWCEPGGYSEEGQIPVEFASEYPTDTP